MDITEFKQVLTSFADEPADVDVRRGKVIAQLRDDIIDATISYDNGDVGRLIVNENGQNYDARNWIINRVARLPQLAERIISSISPEPSPNSPFVIPSANLSPDISSSQIADSLTPDAVAAMRDFASTPTPGATSVLYITSDAGEGKTTVINRAAREQAIRFRAKEVTTLIVPIPLSGKAFLTFDDAVIAALVNKWRFSYLYYDAFINLVKLGLVVPAFDGYEEMLVEGTKGEAVSALGNLVQSLESRGTVFIAARKAFFEYLNFKTQARLLDAIGDRSATFSRLELHRWTKKQFLDYGRLRGVQHSDEIYDAVSMRLTEDHPLLTRAVLVRRLFDVAAEASDRASLVALLGDNPGDYFHTFVDAMVKREANEKWLANVSGDIMEPLLEQQEHHMLLSQIALEMWQSSLNFLRYDIVDVIVEIFCESRQKNARVIQQVKERIRQHSLLAANISKGGTIAFDHEDFQDFYLGEGLGYLLSKGGRAEIATFLSINLVPQATVEQAIQYVVRKDIDLLKVLDAIKDINGVESGFSFCKENCGSISLRLVECLSGFNEQVSLSRMLFHSGILIGRKLVGVSFSECHFQSTSTSGSVFERVEFLTCGFEQLEVNEDRGLIGCSFKDCKVDSLVMMPEEQQSFDPSVISCWLQKSGGELSADLGGLEIVFPEDERLKVFERFLRVFLRSTYIDENFIRVRLGKVHAPIFFDDLLGDLMEHGVLQEIPWKGQGVQRRYKLAMSMHELSRALEKARGSYDMFLQCVDSSRRDGA